MQILFYFTVFFMAHSIFTSYNFWVAKHTESLQILGVQFHSNWTFWAFSLLVATPFLSIANLMFSGTFYYGFRYFNNAWVILLTFIAAQTVAYPFMTYFWFNELPKKGALLGAFLTLLGVVIANIWKD